MKFILRKLKKHLTHETLSTVECFIENFYQDLLPAFTNIKYGITTIKICLHPDPLRIVVPHSARCLVVNFWLD